MTATVLNTKISEVEGKIPDNSKYIITQEFKKVNYRKFCSNIKAGWFSEKKTNEFNIRIT